MRSFQSTAGSVSRILRASQWRASERLTILSSSSRPLSAHSRSLHAAPPRKSSATATAKDSSNPAMSFPCLDAQDAKSALLSARSLESGPEPSYTTGSHERFHCEEPLLLDWGGVLPEFDIAYESWGQLNGDKSNAILLHTGLSASSHAHSTASNPKPGWWEKFIGPGLPLDTNKYFVICTNVLGGCYGSTGPSSMDPSDGKRYATRFPILTLDDMVRAQFRLLDALGIQKLAASVGSSMGGMQSLAAGVLFPERVGKIVSISGCARSHPYSIAMRHTQRQVLMMDPKWARGFYYDAIPPHSGMKLAREIATVTYRSGPEWEQRFGRRRADPSKQPALCPDFLIETYLDHAGEKFCLEYDPNSLLYVSKAMDLFDLGHAHQTETHRRRAEAESRIARGDTSSNIDTSCSLTLPDKPYEEQPEAAASVPPSNESVSSCELDGPPRDLVAGLAPLKNHPVLVMGVASDILFPAWQQREIAETLRAGGNQTVEHIELGEDLSLFGHDTFLLDLKNIGGALGRFLK
ncbi:Serine O-succinyltransferase [Penicillium macrosclerotiorum]|uniref:Serine O-succinyltransferase n=1 Tax=Penicillium macrosclerotiorum TaxID=303699 RepID=UPI002549593F|nr:Serine O-succinyltransferase [Penicillium macrosclerotiorum]KAJ5689490.1 Serine O-succinyltransferase [Penicillium macrosclerotiorum]